MTVSSVQSSTHFQQVHRSAAQPGKARTAAGDRPFTTRGDAADFATTTPGVMRGLDLGALLQMRENVEARSTPPASQKAYADAVEAVAEDSLTPFVGHYGEAEYSLNP